jgi:hypothetical protein
MKMIGSVSIPQSAFLAVLKSDTDWHQIFCYHSCYNCVVIAKNVIPNVCEES